ncbi:MAG: SDR family oxidoreductase [Candidatus Thiodiazotropha sp.]|nr:SDR family oxidoreductase [Candidatus Thiodiazotropha sp.]
MITVLGRKKGFEDYEKADKRVREEQRVPYMLVCPYALTNNEGLEKYKVIQAKKQHFMKSIARADVAKFLVDCVKDTQWDNKDTILLGGAK